MGTASRRPSNTVGNPLYVDAAAGNYAIPSGSPCAGKGPLTTSIGVSTSPPPAAAGDDRERPVTTTPPSTSTTTTSPAPTTTTSATTTTTTTTAPSLPAAPPRAHRRASPRCRLFAGRPWSARARGDSGAVDVGEPDCVLVASVPAFGRRLRPDRRCHEQRLQAHVRRSRVADSRHRDRPERKRLHLGHVGSGVGRASTLGTSAAPAQNAPRSAAPDARRRRRLPAHRRRHRPGTPAARSRQLRAAGVGRRVRCSSAEAGSRAPDR